MDRDALRSKLPWFIALIVMGIAWNRARSTGHQEGPQVVLQVRTSCSDRFQLYWDDRDGNYVDERSAVVDVRPSTGTQEVVFNLPAELHHLQGLRIDPGTQPVRMDLFGLEIRGLYRSRLLSPYDVVEWFGASHDLEVFEADTMVHAVPLKCNGTDPYFASRKDLSALTDELLDNRPPVARPLLLAVLLGLLTWLITRALLSNAPATKSRAVTTSGLPSTGRLIFAGIVSLLVLFLAKGIANNINFHDRALVVELEVTAKRQDNFQVFYARKPGAFSQGYYVNSPVQPSEHRQLLSFRMPDDTLFKFLRFDPGNQQESLRLHAMTLRCNDETLRFTAEQLFELFKPNEEVSAYALQGDAIDVRFNGDDPFLFSDKDIGEDVRALWEASGNGSLPFWFGLICAVATFAGLSGNQRLDTLRLQAKPIEVATASLFCLLIAVPMLSDVLPLEPYVPDTEKRPLAEKPLLRMHSLEEFPDKYAAYYGDHFPFRKLLFRWNSEFHAKALRCSSMPNNVVFGKNNYLFLMKPGVERFYRHQDVFTQTEMQRIAERLDHRKKWLAERGIDYYLIVPPLKGTMYPEQLPDKFRKVDGRSELDDLKEYLDQHCSVKLIDLRNELREAKQVRDIYYTSDIHWNPWGGFIGYQVLMRELLKDHPELGSACLAQDYIVEADTNDNGDLAMQLAMNDAFPRITYMMVPQQPFRAQSLPEEPLPASAFFKYKPVFCKGPDPQAPKLLMFRDSFAVYLMPYLNEHFSRAVYVWTPILIPDIVEKEKPDIVVQEIMELFLPDLLQDKLTDPL